MIARGMDHQMNHRFDRRPGGMGRGFAGPFDVTRGAEALEIAFVRLSYAIDMTQEQEELFEDLKADTLSAAQTFEDAVSDLRPNFNPEERPDIAGLLDIRIAVETAKLEAMTAVQPAFEAFFSSLTDEQIAELMPRRATRTAPPDKDQPAQAPAEPVPGTSTDAAPAQEPAEG